jgi:outer membrane protein assembly factor BamA
MRAFAFFRVAMTVTVLSVSAPVAVAQEPATRAEALRQEREEKSKQLAQPESSGLERVLLDLENGRWMERFLSPPEGLYPRVGNITAGSGISIGPGFRRPGMLGGHMDFQASAAASFTKYWLMDTHVQFPRLARDRVSVEVHTQRYDFPEQEYFGLGPDSNREDLVLYGLSNTVFGVSSAYRPTRWLTFGGVVDRLTPRVRADSEPGQILSLFDEVQAPGVFGQPTFLQYDASAEVNYQQPRGNPRRGGRYGLTVQRFDDREGDLFSFTKAEASLVQYISLLRDRRVLALRAVATVTDPDTGSEVPFYLLPTLGGPDDLRGFRRFRFRDRHSLLFQAEYRWEIFSALDGAIFYDAGKVASRVEDLNLEDLESDYGIGFRFGTANGVFLRVEGAFGSAGGKHFILRFSNVF